MEYQITKATLADLALMNRLFFLTVTLHGTNFLSEESIKKFSKWAVDKEHSKNAILDNIVYNAKLHGEVVGSFSLSKEGVINYIFVNPSYVGRGIARGLYDKLEEVAIDHNIKTITTSITEQVGPFYKKLGFDIVKDVENVVGGEQFVRYSAVKNI